MKPSSEWRRYPRGACPYCPRWEGTMISDNECPRDRRCFERWPALTNQNREALYEPQAGTYAPKLEVGGLYWYFIDGQRFRVSIWKTYAGELTLWFLDLRAFVPLSQCPTRAAFTRTNSQFK